MTREDQNKKLIAALDQRARDVRSDRALAAAGLHATGFYRKDGSLKTRYGGAPKKSTAGARAG
jgi:hypothetical protein